MLFLRIYLFFRKFCFFQILHYITIMEQLRPIAALQKHIASPAILAAFLSLFPASLALADDDLDGRYLCQSGVVTALQSIDRIWQPASQEPHNFELLISQNGSQARIEKIDYECRIVFFEILSCTTGYYHFAVNTKTGRFTYDKSYGFIRGEDPRGDAEMVSTSLGICHNAPSS